MRNALLILCVVSGCTSHRATRFMAYSATAVGAGVAIAAGAETYDRVQEGGAAGMALAFGALSIAAASLIAAGGLYIYEHGGDTPARRQSVIQTINVEERATVVSWGARTLPPLQSSR